MIVMDSAAAFKRFLALTGLKDTALAMVQRVVVAFMLHTGRMTCSSAAGSLASQPVHRAQITRFLARRRWQQDDFNEPLRNVLLQLESRDGKFMFIIDATLVSQSGKQTQNTFSTGNPNDLITGRKLNGQSKYLLSASAQRTGNQQSQAPKEKVVAFKFHDNLGNAPFDTFWHQFG